MISWDQAREIIRSRELQLLTRSPEQIAEYTKAKEEFKRLCGGTAQFILEKRVQWADDLTPAAPGCFLHDARDVKVLLNDFSYNFTPNIRHFVVWSKVRCETDEDQFPTAKTTEQIETFLRKTFVEKLGLSTDNITWFKNTVRLQSVPTLEHFHVLVRDIPDELIHRVEGTAGHLSLV